MSTLFHVPLRGHKTKLKELIQEKEHLQKRLKEREAGFLETRNALGKELKEVREEGNSWRRRMEGMEGKVTAWKLEKSSLESQLRYKLTNGLNTR